MAVGDKIYIATKTYVDNKFTGAKEYIDQEVGNLTDKINQDISDVTDSINKLNDMVDLAVIDTQSGNGFVQTTIADEGTPVEIVIEGKTVVTPLDPTQDISPDNPATITSVVDNAFDVVATGKNLLVNNAASSTTINGITFTVNPDKSITMNGTATKNANFPIFEVNWNDISSRMPLNPSQTYILSRGSANAIIYLRDAISNKNFETPLGGTRLITGISQFTYVYIQVAAGRTCNNETIYPQLEIGSVATSYEPYKGSNKITISSFSGRSLPNGVCDKLELFANGKRRDIQNVCIAVFDGSNDENWVLGPLQPNDLTLARICYNNQNIAMGSKVISDRFEFESSNYWQKNWWSLITKECIAPHATTGQINIIIKKSRIQGWSDDLSSSEKIALFKAWLATNPVTALYELAEPIITESEYAQLKTYKGTTNILTTSQLQPTLAAKFYSRLGNSTEVIMARLDQLTQALLALGGTV